VHEARELKSPLDAELRVSHLLGVFWDQRYTLPLEEAASPDYGSLRTTCVCEIDVENAHLGPVDK
jgi:hypothetical protein